MDTIRAWAAVVTYACHTSTTPAESALIFEHPAINLTNTKKNVYNLQSPNILSLIAIPAIDTCHSPSAPWHIRSRTMPVLRKARCNLQGHGKSIHTQGSTPDSETTFSLATRSPGSSAKSASGHMSLYEALLSKSAQGHLQGYPHLNYHTIFLYEQRTSHHSGKQASVYLTHSCLPLQRISCS